MSGPPVSRPGVRPPATGGDAPALAADLLLVALFVLLGRASHREGGAVAGYLATAWPFLTATLLGWAVLGLARRTGRGLPGRSLSAGCVVLAATVAGGMLLRRAFTEGGTPVSFLVVATIVLAVFLLGWRAVGRARLARAVRG